MMKNKGLHKNLDKRLYWVVASALLSACVTINIYFPAAAAEKAADKIIEEVWQLKNKEGQAPETKPTETKPADAKPAEPKAPEAK